MSISTGATAPTTTTLTGTGSPWSLQNNILVSDGAYTTAPLTTGQIRQTLIAAGFGFAIPLNATLNGFTVTVKGKQSGGLSALPVHLAPAGTVSGTQKNAAFTTSDATYTLGSTSDLWGLTTTPASVNNATFGVAVGPVLYDDGVGGSQSYSVDAVTLSVTYTPLGYTKTITVTSTLAASRLRGITQHRSAAVVLSSSLQRGIAQHFAAAVALTAVNAKGLVKTVATLYKLTSTLPVLRASAARLSLKRYRVWIWVKHKLDEDEWIN